MIGKTALTLVVLVLFTLVFGVAFASAQASNTYQEVNPRVIFDDEGAVFWGAYNTGVGSLVCSVTTETGTVQVGSSSLEATVVSGSFQNVGFYHNFTSMVDWSAYSVIAFWLKGSNSGEYISFTIVAPTTNDYLVTLIRDNFTEWQRYVFVLNENFTKEGHFFKVGNPNLSQVQGVGFSFDSPLTVYVDRMILDVAPPPTPALTPTPTPTTSPIVAPTPTPTATSTPQPLTPGPSTPIPTSSTTSSPNTPTEAPTSSPTTPIVTSSPATSLTPTNPPPTQSLSPSHSPSPSTSPSPSPSPPPMSAGVAEALTTTGAAVTAVATIAATTLIASAIGESLSSVVSQLPFLRQILEFFNVLGEEVFKTVQEEELRLKKKIPFISKAELVALTTSVLIMIFVYSFVEAGGLGGFLNLEKLAEVLPIVCITVFTARLMAIFADAIAAKTCSLQKKFCLWPSGIIAILISGLIFLFPFSIPWITKFEGLHLSRKSMALMMLLKTMMLMILTLPFAILLMFGAEEIANIGFLIVFAWTAAALIPLKPMAGKFLFNYKKSLSLLALVLIMILLYGFTIGLFEPIAYLAVGVISILVTAITYVFLKRSLSESQNSNMNHAGHEIVEK